jgi:hypothetical protein
MPAIKPMLDSLGSIKKGQKIRKGMNQTKSKDISSLIILILCESVIHQSQSM